MIEFLIENKETLFALAVAVVGVATIVVQFTKTKVDDLIVGKIHNFLRMIALGNQDKAE